MKARTKRVISVLGILFVVAAAVLLWLSYRAAHLPPDITAEIFGSADVRSAFTTAQSVTVQRLHWREPHDQPHELESYDHGPELPVSAATVQQLQALFQQPGSFEWNSVKSCAPDYGVLFTFHSPQHDVQLALCFQCLIFGIYDAGSEVNAEEDFDPIASKLANLIKPLFPGDKDIQDLK